MVGAEDCAATEGIGAPLMMFPEEFALKALQLRNLAVRALSLKILTSKMISSALPS